MRLQPPLEQKTMLGQCPLQVERLLTRHITKNVSLVVSGEQRVVVLPGQLRIDGVRAPSGEQPQSLGGQRHLDGHARLPLPSLFVLRKRGVRVSGLRWEGVPLVPSRIRKQVGDGARRKGREDFNKDLPSDVRVGIFAERL